MSTRSHYLLSDLIKWLTIFSIIVLTIGRNEAKVLAQNKLCADNECKVAIASGKTTVMYQRSDDKSLSFPPDVNVIIYGKTEDEKHLDVEINGKRGFAPKTHILEEKVFDKNPQILVKIDSKQENLTKTVDNKTDVNVQNESSNEIEEKPENLANNEETIEEESKQSNEEPKVFSSLLFGEDIEGNEAVTPTTGDFTVIDGTTFPIDDYVYEASPTIPPEPATATKTATISLNLDNREIEAPNATVEPSDDSNNLVEESVKESAHEEVNESVEEKDEPSLFKHMFESVFPFGGNSDNFDEVKEEVEVKDSFEDNKVDSSLPSIENDVKESDNVLPPVENDISNNVNPVQTSAENFNTDNSDLENNTSVNNSTNNTNEDIKSLNESSEESTLNEELVIEKVIEEKKVSFDDNQDLYSFPEVTQEAKNNDQVMPEDPEILVKIDSKQENLTQTVDNETHVNVQNESSNESHEKLDNLSNNDETIVKEIQDSFEDNKEDNSFPSIETEVKESDTLLPSVENNISYNVNPIQTSGENLNTDNSDLKNNTSVNNFENNTSVNNSENNTNEDIKSLNESDEKSTHLNEELVIENVIEERKVSFDDNQHLYSSPDVTQETKNNDEVMPKNPQTQENLTQTVDNITHVNVQNESSNESDEKPENLTNNDETIVKEIQDSFQDNKVDNSFPSIENEVKESDAVLPPVENDILNNVNPFLTSAENFNTNNSDLENNTSVNNSTNNTNEDIKSLNESSDKSTLNEELLIEKVIEEKKVSFDDKQDLYSSPEVTQETESNEKVMPSEDISKWIGLDGMAIIQVISDIIPDDIELVLKHFQISTHLVVFTSIIAFNWCLMKVLLSVLLSSRKETELRDVSCKAQRQVYYFEAEKEKLQNEIDREREKAQLAEERMQTAEHKVIPLEKEFRKLKTERDQLQQKAISLESELESATDAGLELNKLLNDFLTSQKENVNLNSSVDALQQQITKQSEIVAKYESTAKQKEKENIEYKDKFKKMNSELERLKSVLKETEHNLEIVQSNNEELKVSKSELNSNFNSIQEEYFSLQNKAQNYITRNDELLSEVEKFRQEIDSLKEQFVNKDLEIESMKELLNNLKRPESGDENDEEVDGENSSNDLYDVLKVQLELKSMLKEKDNLNSKLEELTNQCKQLNDRLVYLEEDNKALNFDKESALQEKMKAVMELEVLSKYYKEKELELGKAIGVHQVQRIQKEEDATSLASQLISLEEENISIKSQLKSMKKEVEDTERKYKSQINQLEKQVHENWILARNAERKLEESKAEASVLRQTLTMSVKSPVDGYGGDLSYLDDSASSISSLHDHLGTALPPPPPPPLPPLPPMALQPYNSLMPGMHMPYSDESDSTALWSQSMHGMGVRPQMPDMHNMQMHNNFAPIQMDNTMNNHSNVNYSSGNQTSHPLTYVPSVPQQWDSSSNRDTFSPASHRSNGSPQSTYNNMYSQPIVPQSHFSNPMMSMSMSSPLTNSGMSTMAGHYHNSMTTVSSPLVNSSPLSYSTSQPALSNPIPSHWTRPNGNIPNLDYSQTEYNGSNSASRPISRSDSNSLHTSIV